MGTRCGKDRVARQRTIHAGWLYAIEGKPDSRCVDVHGYVASSTQPSTKCSKGTNIPKTHEHPNKSSVHHDWRLPRSWKDDSAGELAQHLTSRGLRVGLITNDRGMSWWTRRCCAREVLPRKFQAAVSAAGSIRSPRPPSGSPRRHDRRFHRRAGRQLHRSRRRDLPAAAHLWRRFLDRAGERPRRPGARAACAWTRRRRQFLQQSPLYLPQTTRGGGHHRDQQDRPAR